MFGAVNALFSGLAFAGIIYTIFLQKEELALQREELKANREELARAAKAQEASEIQLRAQAEILRLTAKINAINALRETYIRERSSFPPNAIFDPLQKPRLDALDAKTRTLDAELERIFNGAIEEQGLVPGCADTPVRATI